LPDQNIRLRRPRAGLAGGFIRAAEPSLAGRVASCVGEFNWTSAAGMLSPKTVVAADRTGRCGDSEVR
jgi:hypothetical protein